MKPYLLDVNLMLALAWPNHVHRADAHEWLARNRAAGFRTCPFTQAAFVRISSNPAFTPAAVTPHEALQILRRMTELPGHGFWPDDLPFPEAARSVPPLMGHRQVMDAYLIALAQAHGGVLATLDRATLALARNIPGAVELVR